MSNYENILKENNLKLADVLKKHKTDYLRIIAYGNSIAAGYSVANKIKPLIERNTFLTDILGENGITLEKLNYTRAISNSDEKLLLWLLNDIKISEINKQYRTDFSKDNRLTKITTESDGISDEDILKYFPKQISKDYSINDAFFNTGSNKQSNIVVYSGGTGSLIDNLFRDGKHFPTYGITRDLHYLYAMLTYLKEKNRQGANTQIYICGVPNWFGLNITNIINNKLKKAANNFANANYIPGIPSKGFYKNFQGKVVFDTHYDEEENLKLNGKIVESIANNFSKTKEFIILDRSLVNYENELHYTNPQNIENDELVIKEISDLFQSAISNQSNLEEISKLLQSTASHDFLSIGRQNIKKSTQNLLR